MALIFEGKAESVEDTDQVVRTVTMTIQVPAVIRLIYSVTGKCLREPTLCRNSIIRRDGSTCQYCKRKYLAEELTIDHVIPKSRGGEYKWDNLVAACKPCNNRKGDRTPREAGMHLNKKPRRPGADIQFKVDERWKKWLPMYKCD